MIVSNSPLATYKRISPFRTSPRNHTLDVITPHVAVGQVSVETLGALFQTKEASSNYGIGYEGSIAMYVEEKDRSWCSDSRDNDNRAVTIECACDPDDPFKLSGTVYSRLIELMTDICIRNGKKKLIWLGDKQSTLAYLKSGPKPDEMVLTAHRWFNAGKSCPGDWLYSRYALLAYETTKKIDEVRDLTKAETLQLIREEEARTNPVYNTLEEVPDYWRDDIAELVSRGIIKGGANGKLELKRSEAKMAVIVKRAMT